MLHENHRFPLLALAAFACAFLLVNWMATKTILFLHEAQMR